MRVVGNYGTSLFNYLDKSKDLKQVLAEGVDYSTLSAAARKTLEEKGILLDGTKSSSKNTSSNNDIYTSIRTATDQLRETTAKLSSTGTSSIYEDAKKSGDTKEVVKEAETFVSKYNQMISAMKKMGGSTNTEYSKQLSQLVETQKDTLKKIGVTSAEDGSLTIDEDTLKNESVDNIEAAFAGTGKLADQVAEKSIYVEANAISAMYDSAVNNYTSNGDYSELATSSFLKNI